MNWIDAGDEQPTAEGEYLVAAWRKGPWSKGQWWYEIDDWHNKPEGDDWFGETGTWKRCGSAVRYWAHILKLPEVTND